MSLLIQALASIAILLSGHTRYEHGRIVTTNSLRDCNYLHRCWIQPSWYSLAKGVLADIADGKWPSTLPPRHTVYPKKYAHGFVVLCFVVVMQSFIMNSHEVFIHIHQGCFAGTGAIVRLPQCQWSKPDGYGKISQCITTTKHSKTKTVCIFLGIYCSMSPKWKWHFEMRIIFIGVWVRQILDVVTSKGAIK